MTRRRPLGLERHRPCRAVEANRRDLLVAKSAIRCPVALETTRNLTSIRSVKAAKSAGREVMLDCEHSSTAIRKIGIRAACAKTAYDSGARWVVLAIQWRHHAHEVESMSPK
jgi:2-isopropylmalate synthase